MESTFTSPYVAVNLNAGVNVDDNVDVRQQQQQRQRQRQVDRRQGERTRASTCFELDTAWRALACGRPIQPGRDPGVVRLPRADELRDREASVKQRLGLIVRVLGTLGALAWIATRIDLAAARDALGRIPLATFALATALVAGNAAIGALRWKAVLRAYGATRIAPLATLVRLYFVAFFYNTYLPGAVAGDVGRAVVTRDAFDGEGATGALAVVLVERALGLFGLFALLAVGLIATRDTVAPGALWWWTVLGCFGSFALVALIPLARTLGARLPVRLARVAQILARLPALRAARPFATAIALSIATQALVALAGWVLLVALAPIDLASSLLVVPLAAATAFLPITVGGAGAREAVYVALCGRLFGMAAADALAASLGLWLAHLAVGAIGGIAQLARRRAT